MANTVIQKNGTHKRQERYADAIVKLMRQQFNIRNEFSRDYEGNPVSAADGRSGGPGADGGLRHR